MPGETSHNDYTARLSRIAAEMAILFTPGHNVEQSIAYESKRSQYLQEIVDAQWCDYSAESLHKDYRSCG